MATQTAHRAARIRRPARLAWDASALTRWAGSRIRWKIILPYALLVIALAAGGNYLATSLVQGPLDERFQNQLVQAGRAASDSVVRHEEAQLETARSVAFTQGLAPAIEDRDRAFVRGVAESIAVNTRSEFVDVLDTQGNRVAGVVLSDPGTLDYSSVPASDDPGAWPLVALALGDTEGAKYAQIVETTLGPSLMTASPVFDGDDLSGLVLVATSLSTLAAEIKAEALADVTVYDFAGDPIASTLASEVGGELTVSAEVLTGEGEGVFRDSRVVAGRRYDFVYGELVVRGRLAGYYSVALASDFIFDADSDARWQMTLLFGAGMALALAAGFVVAGSLTRRIRQLVLTAERVTEGDLTARTEVRSQDELGKLGACLNRMTDRLEGQYMATMRALASAVAGSDPYTVRHSFRVGELAVLLGRRLGANDRMLAQLEIGGYLHDIGKIGVRDSALLRSENVQNDLKPFLSSHPHIGSEPEITKVRGPLIDFIGEESVHIGDGGASDETPIVGRIVVVADLYDALTADRHAGEGTSLSSEEALEVMRRWAAGRLLHFGTVEVLAQIVPQWERSQGRGSDYAQLKRERQE
jgi:HAMP domain-containing protein